MLILLSGLLSCASTTELDGTLKKYLATGDYASLEILASHLKVGMTREQTETLLGPSNDDPSIGVYRYGTDRKVLDEQTGVYLYVNLVVSFRDFNGKETNELKSWGFGAHGE